MKAKQFFTRSNANKGVALAIPDVDGKETVATFTVRGFDSDEFNKALIARSKELVEIEQLPDEDKEEARENSAIRLIASLVTSWDLEDEFSHEAVTELLTEAPYIRRLVDNFAAERKNFLGKL